MKITYEDNYLGHPINTDAEKGQGCYLSILEASHAQLSNIISHYSRVVVIRFDLHMPAGSDADPELENQLLSKFFKQLKENLALKKWGNHSKVVYGWSAEIEKAKARHFHCWVAFKTKNTQWIFNKYRPLIYRIWNFLSDGSIHISEKSHVVNRNKEDEFNEAFHHITYLAKERGKQYGKGFSQKNYNHSRLKPKPPKETNSPQEMTPSGVGL